MMIFVEAFQKVRFASRDLKPAMAAGLPGMTRHTNIPCGRKKSTLSFFLFVTISKQLLNLVDALHTETNFAVNIFAKDNPSGKERVNCEVFFFDKFNPLLEESIHLRRAIRKGQS